MRIGLCGVKTEGFENFIAEFLKTWTMYKIDRGSIALTEFGEGDPKCEYDLLNGSIDCAMKYNKTKDILHINSSLDSLANIFWCAGKELAGFDEQYIQRAIHLTKQSMTFYDILFYFPITNKNHENVKETELNNFYDVILESYATGKKWIFPFDDVSGSPPMIEIFGNIQEKIEMCKLYLSKDGQPYSQKDSLITAAIS